MAHPYVLHYAPDNASLPVRLVLEELGVAYRTRLVDRASEAQRKPEYLAVNPTGLIPALETPYGVVSETAAILLWLADRHGALFPATADPARGERLRWLFFASNTLHAELRRLFYARLYVGGDEDDQSLLRRYSCAAISGHLQLLDTAMPDGHDPDILDWYLAAMLRWCALYPQDFDHSWFDLQQYPALQSMALRIEARDSTHAAQTAEGLGPTPFTAPRAPEPPEGSAL
ncbi:glutathione S-transferase family protein [uncultured Roseobacter sp.]|uniref:glutathione S-transferase family protein n=1 Tax=uncultured Roseobacter sp. TaxID=114847 RepID=UPI002603C404|nr:glutathione S-transferase family protein [uncultured Roseobacter sp.]